MKNAIESLTQDDAESALVFALVHDSEFRLATAVASVRFSHIFLVCHLSVSDLDAGSNRNVSCVAWHVRARRVRT